MSHQGNRAGSWAGIPDQRASIDFESFGSRRSTGLPTLFRLSLVGGSTLSVWPRKPRAKLDFSCSRHFFMASASLYELVQLLQGVLSPSAETRKAAETSLSAVLGTAGVGLSLVIITSDHSRPNEVRQLSAVLLRKLVKEHWSPESKHFQKPVVHGQEKASIRQSLPQGLGDESAKLQTAVGLVIATIAKWDVPDEWPQLLPALLGVIQSKSNDLAGRHGQWQTHALPYPGASANLHAFMICSAWSSQMPLIIC